MGIDEYPRIAGLDERHIDGSIGLRAGMGLHVHIFAAEQFLGPIDRQLFGNVGEFAPAVIAAAWISLG